MSFWVFGPKKSGRRSLYSVGLHPVFVIIYGAILIAMLLPLIRLLRDVLQ